MCCSAPLLAVGVVPSPEIVERIDSNTNECGRVEVEDT